MFGKEEFGEFVKGKRVALVGRSACCLEQEAGELIDSYDVVCRLNNAEVGSDAMPMIVREEKDSFVPENQIPFIGKKVDVFYANMVFHSYDNGLGIGRNLRHNGASWVVMTGLREFMRYAMMTFDLNKIIPVRALDVDFFFTLMKELDWAEPMPGTFTIADLLQFDLKKLFVTGVMCFQMEGEKEYAGLLWNHDYRPQMDFHYLARRVLEDKRLKMDVAFRDVMVQMGYNCP